MRFTQFLFPDGTRSENEITRPPEIEAKALALNFLGFVFEIENNNGTIWMSCVRHKTDDAVDEICLNGPNVPIYVDRLVNAAYDKWVET